MITNKSLIKFFILVIFILTPLNINAEIIILSMCKNLKDGFIKNDYILDLEKSLMTRNYIYNEKTYQKYKLTDISIKKKNTLTRFIYEEDSVILTDKIGYPQFYTQLLFTRDSADIKIKTVINNEVGISKISICKKIEILIKKVNYF